MPTVELAPDFHSTLSEVFGFSEFRGRQAEAVATVVEGGDAFVLKPTGGGKSLCYQLPGVVLPGTAIVISPLIALSASGRPELQHAVGRATRSPTAAGRRQPGSSLCLS